MRLCRRTGLLTESLSQLILSKSKCGVEDWGLWWETRSQAVIVSNMLENFQRRGLQLVPICGICKKDVENLNHLVVVLPICEATVGMDIKNKIHFEDESNNFIFCTKYVKQQVNCAIHTSKGTIYGTAYDHFVRLAWGAEPKLRKAPQIKECKWLLPKIDQVIKVNVDGSSMGNPGSVGWGATYRDHNGEYLLVSCKGLGVETNYVAECYAILENAEVAIIEKSWLNLWLEFDSAAVIEAFSTDKIP
ncbi:hypothetical protein IFM89_031367 [Coptis chinensis]|uniref:RNase H type-1 domain-containing protein n=1 Tax=Coptis chinensis TaxID=261450 RepID=A0A835IW47_9MAGN|nr:hypothetical protein IFM89_031367 [Coptis chinensis]